MKTIPGNTYRYYIGIDCGVKTGYALYDRQQKKLLQVCSKTILSAINEVREIGLNNPGEVLVRIEDPRLRKWIPWQKNEKAERGRNRGAGSVMRDAQIWEEFLEAEDIHYELVAPKNNKTKVKDEYFKTITGWKQPTNEHGRDAAMLVYGI